MLLAKTLSFYKRPDVRKAIVEQAKDKEVAIRYADYFGKRPDALLYEEDVLEIAKKKATSFHCSEELWTNPLALRSDMKKQEVDEIRKGWDLILDIDCHHFVYSKLAAHLLVKILQDTGIKNVTCKFSGNKGFHLAVPFESFPETVNGKPTKELFPDAPRRIAAYLKDKLLEPLGEAILKIEKNNISNVEKRTGLPFQKLVKQMNTNDSALLTESKKLLDVSQFLEIDTILIAPRHLYRMPYSFHEKSLLVSVPVEINKILQFKKEQAKPENVRLDIPFIDRKNSIPGEAQQLIINAFDFHPAEEKERKIQKEFTLPEEAIEEDLFPPCIKLALQGLEDGKKRTLFTLINFLKGAGWNVDSIEEKIYEWNKKNPEPLREVYLKGQIKQARKTKEAIPPHNCKSYYQDLRICQPDSFCQKIKNPLQYAKLKQEINKPKGKKGRKKLTPEQLEMRRKYRELKKQKQKEGQTAETKVDKK